MSDDIGVAVQTKVYTTKDGRVAIEQSEDSIVLLPAEQILTIIKELHVCYDYCAAWKDATPDETAVGTEDEP